jgi:hypothetical protein
LGFYLVFDNFLLSLTMENDWNLPEDDVVPETPPQKTKDLIVSWAEQLAELVDTKTALKIKDKQVTLKHQYDMEVLSKKHEIDLNKHNEFRKTLLLVAGLGIVGFALLIVLIYVLAQVGLGNFIPAIIGGLSTIVTSVGSISAYHHYTKNSKKS